MLRHTGALLYHWPKFRNEFGNGHTALNMKKYAKFIYSDKKTLVHAKMVSSAGHPWYHTPSKRHTATRPEKRSQVAFDPIVQRNCLFVEKKGTGMAVGKLKWTQ